MWRRRQWRRREEEEEEAEAEAARLVVAGPVACQAERAQWQRRRLREQ